ncbi:chorion peroxidase-like [Dreissena polymorpha]|uniref:chorion peroxidase-like n=1 Tax=Dreissena polymorpha TaxID=45954 RepID=UPI0022652C6A|nr:chorion peroxidase-like [Dreissena polymorpha]
MVSEGKLSGRQRRKNTSLQGKIFKLWEAYESGELSVNGLLRKCRKATPRTRSATTNKLLPSPRVVSNVIHKAGEAMEKESNLSYMIMQMGQFLSHDFIMTKSFTNDDETPLECCGDDKECSECFPISIPAGDTMNTTCLSFARSKSVFDCDGIRQQLNGQSSYLDLSCLYGTDEDAANELRLFKGGELNVSSTNNLPPDMDDSTCELEGSYDEAYNYCPMSGDPRVNENAGLSAFHTLLHRAHNIFARGLAFVNPHWKDEELFQNARKILVGIWQKIVYGDYLPLIVGEQAMKSHNINISPDGYKETYNVNTDATVTNEGGIAFRFGHSNIHRMMVLQDQDYKLSMTPEPLQLSYFKCKWYHAFNGRGHEDVLRWTADAACPRSDRLLEPSVQQTLFEDGRGISSDLAALNIQSHPF